jgi:hypothetical protein
MFSFGQEVCHMLLFFCNSIEVICTVFQFFGCEVNKTRLATIISLLDVRHAVAMKVQMKCGNINTKVKV